MVLSSSMGQEDSIKMYLDSSVFSSNANEVEFKCIEVFIGIDSDRNDLNFSYPGGNITDENGVCASSLLLIK